MTSSDSFEPILLPVDDWDYFALAYLDDDIYVYEEYCVVCRECDSFMEWDGYAYLCTNCDVLS